MSKTWKTLSKISRNFTFHNRNRMVFKTIRIKQPKASFTHSNTVDVPNGESDLPSQLLLVELHLHDFKRKSFVEQAVDLGTARQFHRIDLCRPWPLNGPLKVRLQLLDHSTKDDRSKNREKMWVTGRLREREHKQTQLVRGLAEAHSMPLWMLQA